jgi:predicted dehydrogenase
MMAKRRLRLAMAGGGEGAFIGAIHRMARCWTGLDLVAGAFSSDPQRNRRTGAAGLSPDRSTTARRAAGRRAARAAGDRIDAVAIVTPNHLHAPMATPR